MRHNLQFALPLSADDVVGHALAAFYRASREATPPIDYPSPAEWSDVRTFVETLTHLFELRIGAQAAASGVSAFEDVPMQLQRWEAHPPSCDRHVSEVDPGLWAEMRAMGHGWPALCAGSAATVSMIAIDVAASNDATAPLSGDRFSESAGDAAGDLTSTSVEDSSSAPR